MMTASKIDNGALEGISEAKRIAQNAVNRGNVVSWVILALLVGLLTWIGIEILKNRGQPHVDMIDLSEEKIVGVNSLCPGDVLITRFYLQVEGEGPLVRDNSVQRDSDVVVFSDPQRFPVTGPISQEMPFVWRVPDTIYDFRTGNTIEFPSGDYLLNVSISSMGDDATFDMVFFPFSVKTKEQCDGE
jgi:hypothetical protein